MPYQHGARALEKPTGAVAPITGTAGLQVVFGTAPVNLADDPFGVTNKPVLCYTWAEAVSKLGYSDDYERYTLCASMYASFQLFRVAPVIFVNVLDPATHKKTNQAADVTPENLQATVQVTGVLLNSVSVKKVTVSGEEETETALVLNTDYILSFSDSGYLVITLTASGAGANATKLRVSSTSIDPSAVTMNDVIGVSANGAEKGMETLRQVYPRFGMTPGLLLAPGWSHLPDVGVALAAKCVEINGVFSCEAFVDIDSRDSGCTQYANVKTAKESAGCTSSRGMALWPCVTVGSRKFWYSAVMGALTAYTDAANDDVPNLSPSNKLLGITGTVLAEAVYDAQSGTWSKEIFLDQTQANAVNGFGVATAINMNGWRSWGNNTAAYPATTDPKDRWFCCRRFFSWWGNSFIMTYAQKVDNPADFRLIESIVDTENIRGNAYVAQGKCAAARMEYDPTENTVQTLLDGQIRFRQHLAPYTPAEDILNTLEFDADALAAALNGG